MKRRDKKANRKRHDRLHVITRWCTSSAEPLLNQTAPYAVEWCERNPHSFDRREPTARDLYTNLHLEK
jgi:hypothetical protein